MLPTSVQTSTLKEEKVQSPIFNGLRNFLEMFRHTYEEGHLGGRRRTVEDHNTYDAVMSALNDGELTSEKLGKCLYRTLNISH